MPPPSGSEIAGEPADRNPPRIGGEASSSPFWMMIERPKVTSSGGRMSAAERAVQKHGLERVADDEHERDGDDESDERVEAERVSQHQDQEGGEDDEVAMREVDQPHDAEDQRQAGRVERVEPAEQDALDDGVEPADHPHTPK